MTDVNNNRVQVFGADGRFLRKWGSEGTEEGQLRLPIGVAVDASDRVYVADWSNDRVQVFDPDGSFLRTWGSRGNSEGLFAGPVGIALNASGNVYVADLGNNRVQVFDREGDFLHKWDSAGIGDGRFQRPIGITIDASGNVYVVDMGNDRVRVFNVELAECPVPHMAVGFFVVELGQRFAIRPGGESYANAENAFDFVASAPVTDRVPVCGPVDEQVGR